MTNVYILRKVNSNGILINQQTMVISLKNTGVFCWITAPPHHHVWWWPLDNPRMSPKSGWDTFSQPKMYPGVRVALNWRPLPTIYESPQSLLISLSLNVHPNLNFIFNFKSNPNCTSGSQKSDLIYLMWSLHHNDLRILSGENNAIIIVLADLKEFSSIFWKVQHSHSRHQKTT